MNFKMTDHEIDCMTISTFNLDVYYSVLSRLSNHINIDNNSNIDHLSITGLMDIEQKLIHFNRLLDIYES